MLSKLAVHYYRPDFTEAQAKSLISDMVEDLSDFAVHEVESAIRAYRRDANNKFFPTSGALREPILDERKEQRHLERIGKRPLPTDPRPIMWWMLPEQLWKPHWRETDIPIEWIAAFQKRRERKAARA